MEHMHPKVLVRDEDFEGHVRPCTRIISSPDGVLPQPRQQRRETASDPARRTLKWHDEVR